MIINPISWIIYCFVIMKLTISITVTVTITCGSLTMIKSILIVWIIISFCDCDRILLYNILMNLSVCVSCVWWMMGTYYNINMYIKKVFLCDYV